MSLDSDLNWVLPRPYLMEIEVKDEETDRLGHTNNVSYLKWLETIAWSHMEFLECGWQMNEQMGKAMAITRTEMNYRRSSYAGDKLILGSWITQSDFRLTSERSFQLFRLSDQTLLLDAKMQFACIDLKTGRAAKMPQPLIDAHKRAITSLS